MNRQTTAINIPPYPPVFLFTPPSTSRASDQAVRILTGRQWLDAVVAVHKQVRNELSDEQKSFLLPKQPDYFASLLAGTTGVIFGAFDGQDLVGTVALVWEKSLKTALANTTLTAPDLNKRLKKRYGRGGTGVIQSMGIRKSHANRGFANRLLAAAIAHNMKQGNKHLFAQIAQNNGCSVRCFLSQGFALVDGWSTNGHARYLLRCLPETEREKYKIVEEYAYQPFSQTTGLGLQIAAHLRDGREVYLDQPERGPVIVVARRAKNLWLAYPIRLPLKPFRKAQHVPI